MHTLHKTFILMVLLLPFGAVQALDPVPEFIREYGEAIQDGADGMIAGQRVAAVALLPEVYARRQFEPVWNDPTRYHALLKILRDVESHGLDPADYHVDTLTSWPLSEDPGQQAQRDILATDALIRLGYHLHFGKIDPVQLDPDWNLARQLHEEKPVEVIERALAAPSLGDFLATELAPTGPFYSGLRAALARYRELARTGGWPGVPEGATLKPGEHNSRVPAVRARLAVTDTTLRTDTDDPTLYDAELAAAVERFQRRHGLDVDGAIGPRTLAAMNVPVEARIDQLRINLERTRWVFRDQEARYVVVNVAGFHAYLMENGKVTWDSRAQVGTPYRKTPVFKARMTYLVLNPTWTVPPTILRKDIIPRIKRDPGYLAANDMVLLDRSGQLVDPAGVDLARITVRNFPYTVRQEPGPKNALGRIKFMFPNEHFVYLHDTPSRALFERAERSFSSGCIRVEYPFVLAEQLLQDRDNWSQTKIEERLSTASNQTVSLREPITVFLMYWTAEADADGAVKFFNDVYSRDQAVLDALREPFRFIPLR